MCGSGPRSTVKPASDRSPEGRGDSVVGAARHGRRSADHWLPGGEVWRYTRWGRLGDRRPPRRLHVQLPSDQAARGQPISLPCDRRERRGNGTADWDHPRRRSQESIRSVDVRFYADMSMWRHHRHYQIFNKMTDRPQSKQETMPKS